jgi:site-specific DNA-cytosine methylase
MVKKATKETLADETDKLVHQILERSIDAVIAGFPCQDISGCNSDRAGTSGSRSGLVWEAIRTFRMVGAKYLLLENVAALLNRGMGEILGELAGGGNDCEWDCISAASVGAPHFRPRIYILAHHNSKRGKGCFPKEIQKQPEFGFLQHDEKFEDFIRRSDLPQPTVRRKNDGLARRIHGIGNGNPPAVIRTIMQQLV